MTGTVTIAHPIEGINTIAFEIANDTDTDRHVYINDINIQSFMRNVDWTNNAFTWIEVRNDPTSIGKYYRTDAKTSTTAVYVFCCLRIKPGTYANIEQVIEYINSRLQANIEMTASIGSQTNVSLRDIPCSLYQITPVYDNISEYKINGFEISLATDNSSYIGTADGNVATTKIVPAILDQPYWSIYSSGTNDTYNTKIYHPRPPPIVQYTGNNNYTLDYDDYEIANAMYKSSVRILSDSTTSLNSHAIDFESSITNNMGLTPYRLPIDNLFINKDDEPVICYDNGNDYREYLIDPTKVDKQILATYYVNTTGSTSGVLNRESNTGVSWQAPVAISREKADAIGDYNKLFVVENGLKTDSKYTTDEFKPFNEFIVINETMCPSQLLILPDILISGANTDTDSELVSIRDIFTALSCMITGYEMPLYKDRNPQNGGNISYSTTVSGESYELTVSVWFAGGTPMFLKDIYMSAIVRNIETNEELDFSPILTGALIRGIYDSSAQIPICSDIGTSRGVHVVDRINARAFVHTLTLYGNDNELKAEYPDTSILSENERSVKVAGLKVAGSAMKAEPIKLPKSYVNDSTFAVIMDSDEQDAETINELNGKILVDFAYTFTPGVSFRLKTPGDSIQILTFNKQTFTFDHSKEVRRWDRKYSPSHKHDFRALLSDIEIDMFDGISLQPTTHVIGIYNNDGTGCRFYRPVNIIYDTLVSASPDYRYRLYANFQDVCHKGHQWYTKWYENGDAPGILHSICTHHTHCGWCCSAGHTDLGHVDLASPGYDDGWIRVNWSEDVSRAATVAYNESRDKKFKDGKAIAIGKLLLECKYENGSCNWVTTIENGTSKYRIISYGLDDEIKNVKENLKYYNVPDDQATLVINVMNKLFKRIEPYGPFGEPANYNQDTDPISTWFDASRQYTFSNDYASLGSAYVHYIQGSEVFPSTVYTLKRYFKDVNIYDLKERYGLSLKIYRDSKDGSYCVQLKRNPNNNGNNILPQNDIFMHTCAFNVSCLAIKTVQAIAYASIGTFIATPKELSADTASGIVERSLSDQQDLPVGAVEVNGKIYLMDRNNSSSLTVNTVKYYPFIGFSNILHVYMSSAGNIDQAIESQLPNLRVIRTSMAQVEIPTAFTLVSKVTSIDTDPRSMRFTGTPTIEISSTTGETLALGANNGALKFTPTVPNAEITHTLKENINLPISISPNADSDNLFDGDVVLNALTLSGLNGSISLTPMIRTITSGSLEVQSLNDSTYDLTNGAISGMVSTILSDTTIESALSGSVTGQISQQNEAIYDLTSGTISGTITTPLNETTMESTLSGDIYGQMVKNATIDNYDILSCILSETISANMTMSTSGRIGDLPVKEYTSDYVPTLEDAVGMGDIYLRNANFTQNLTIPMETASDISSTLTVPAFYNDMPITLAGNMPVPVGIDLSNVIGRYDNSPTETRADRLHYQVEIKPYTIPINKTVTVKSHSSKYIYITGNRHRYPLWESTHTLTYKVV